MAQAGYNPDHVILPQINMALLMEFNRYMPVFLRYIVKSARDGKSLRTVLHEVKFNDILVLDMGFT